MNCRLALVHFLLLDRLGCFRCKRKNAPTCASALFESVCEKQVDLDFPPQALALIADRQRLIVALVQKKVGELLAHEKFNHSFQIGMLASFESFFQTAKLGPDDDENLRTFDDADQAEDPEERDGIDDRAVSIST